MVGIIDADVVRVAHPDEPHCISVQVYALIGIVVIENDGALDMHRTEETSCAVEDMAFRITTGVQVKVYNVRRCVYMPKISPRASGTASRMCSCTM